MRLPVIGILYDATFSPLFIGEVSSTESNNRRCVAPPTAFSPLFIGEVSSTAHFVGRDCADFHPFQSPLHRGSLFN